MYSPRVRAPHTSRTWFNRWVDQGATTYTATVALGGGSHTIVMEYYENAWDATAHLSVRNAV
jgi:hypothetical protein